MANPQQRLSSSSAVLTVPNLLSFLRLAGIPLFVYLVIVPHADFLALIVLGVAAITDWADGFLARRLNQLSELGRILDPLADRLYTFAALFALLLRDIVPWWFAATLLLRDVLLLAALTQLRRVRVKPLNVSMLGKTATACLFIAFPLLLLAQASLPAWLPVSDVSWVEPLAWALAGWGLALYVYSGVLYMWQTQQVVADRNREKVKAEA